MLAMAKVLSVALRRSPRPWSSPQGCHQAAFRGPEVLPMAFAGVFAVALSTRGPFFGGPPAARKAGPCELVAVPLSQQLMLDTLCPADLFFPGATKQSFMHLQPGVSHPSIYIDTNGQPSSLPDVEGSAVPRLAVQSPRPPGICE
ncbi:hypothetical protein Anapl_18878 [Anas platyrhynchos]|uniref:Uncharacterized protein n=1 Tax=Anas platyrhynchos TaxID=8839 RepID=R0KZF4_ANAPL|nr:hypothetical protein Anapl_18878 [Anas platyrhynchos]